MVYEKKVLPQYCQFYKTLKFNFWNTDGYTNKNSLDWKKRSFEATREEKIQFSYKIGP